MTTTTLTPVAHTPIAVLPSLQSAKKHTQSVFANIAHFYQHIRSDLSKHTDLISSFSITALRSCEVASRAFSAIPLFVGRLAFSSLSYMGIVSLNVQVRHLTKTMHDCLDAAKDRALLGVLAMAVKVASKVSNVFFTALSFATSLVSLVGYAHITMLVYSWLVPVGLASWVAAIALEIYHDQHSGSVARTLALIDQATDRDQKISNLFHHLLGDQVEMTPIRRGEIIREIDLNNWEMLKNTLITKKLEWTAASTGKETRASLFKGIQKAVLQHRNFTRANLGLMALGYIAIAIGRAFPQSLTQALVYWGMSVLYTSKSVWQKFKQMQLAQGIEK